jgi:hypothetical protein
MAISTDFSGDGGSMGDRMVENRMVENYRLESRRVALNTLTQYDNDYHSNFLLPL